MRLLLEAVWVCPTLGRSKRSPRFGPIRPVTPIILHGDISFRRSSWISLMKLHLRWTHLPWNLRFWFAALASFDVCGWPRPRQSALRFLPLPL